MYYCVRRGKKKKRHDWIRKKIRKVFVPRLNSMSIITRKDYYVN